MLEAYEPTRTVATGDDTVALYTLTIPDVVQRYMDAGLPRNPRSIQRYAAAQKLKSQKTMTATGELYLINPESVDLHITELRQLEAQARLVATGRDTARPHFNLKPILIRKTTCRDREREVATCRRLSLQPQSHALPRQWATPQERRAATCHDNLLAKR